MPTFPRIRKRGNNAVNTPAPVKEPNEDVAELNADPDETLLDENLPFKEIAIDMSQHPDETVVDEGCYAPRCLEFWKVQHVMSTCNCGNTFCVTDGLCGIIPPALNAYSEAKASRGRNNQSPSFIKVEKMNPNKSGFIVRRENRGSVSSISRAVGDLEELDEEEQQHHNTPKRVLKRMESYHVAVLPLKHSSDDSFSGIDKEESVHHLPKEIAVNASKEMHKLRFVHDRVLLPMRAGRNKSRDVDGDGISPDGQVKLRSSSPINNSETGSKTATNNKSRISRLPMVVGKMNKTQVRKTSVLATGEGEKNGAPFDEQEVSRNEFIERRRCLIAATRKKSMPGGHQETKSEHHPLDEVLDFEPMIDVSHDVSFEEIESTHRESKTNNLAGNKVKKENVYQSASKTNHKSIDYSLESGMTTEETYEEESEEPAYVSDEMHKREVKRNTKAGWITRQLGRKGRMDIIEGVQNIELVYTP